MTKPKKEFKTSTHHILCKSRGGSNEWVNLIELRHNYHQAIHTLFQNQMIARQLLTTIDLSDKELREDVREWLIDVITSRNIDDPHEWYIWPAIKI